eukprot:scaffold490087_cov19-Prasinocladus_malaysianus.AAC.1
MTTSSSLPTRGTLMLSDVRRFAAVMAYWIMLLVVLLLLPARHHTAAATTDDSPIRRSPMKVGSSHQ